LIGGARHAPGHCLNARFAAAAFTYVNALAAVQDEPSVHRLEVSAEGLALAETSGDPIATTGLRCVYAVNLTLLGRSSEALTEAQRALDDARALRQPTLEIAALFALGYAKVRSDPAEAIALLRTSLELGRGHHSESESGVTLGMLAYLEARRGAGRDAVEALRDKI
jgi:hypothetical protein